MPVKLNSSATGEEGDEARIEIIPLIDIMFFLLASFMLVSLSMTHLHRVPLTLPEASTGVADSKMPPFQISIDVNGVPRWDREIVTLSEISTRLRAMAVPEETRVLISADAESRHKQIIGVLNAVREAGVTKVSFESKYPNP
ncbi:MAG: biopolymer transporter ExbD [Gloeobacteraceae cyanobacterium ES-bin-144]|nr:biopolymer transporter ExbD [Verrucomicrobiales bacterium]